MIKILLFFCDDSQWQPFWLGNSEWDDEKWNQFQISRIDGNCAMTPEAFVRKIIEELNKYNSAEFFVVTDGNFGRNRLGGSALLKLLDSKGIKKGVVYSEDPQLDQSLQNKGKYIFLRRETNDLACQVIQNFFLNNIIPIQGGREERIGLLSQAIHRLQNVFLPVTLDAATLKDMKVDDPNVIGEIFREHFGSGADSYLTRDSQKHDGGDIVTLTERVCSSLPQNAQDKVVVAKATLIESVDYVSCFGNQGGFAGVPVKSRLQKQLQDIADAGMALVQALRDVRKEIQGDIK